MPAGFISTNSLCRYSNIILFLNIEVRYNKKPYQMLLEAHRTIEEAHRNLESLAFWIKQFQDNSFHL